MYDEDAILDYCSEGEPLEYLIEQIHAFVVVFVLHFSVKAEGRAEGDGMFICLYVYLFIREYISVCWVVMSDASDITGYGRRRSKLAV